MNRLFSMFGLVSRSVAGMLYLFWTSETTEVWLTEMLLLATARTSWISPICWMWLTRVAGINSFEEPMKSHMISICRLSFLRLWWK